MVRPKSKHPTPAELEVLKVLWAEPRLTVRAVMGRLNESSEEPRAYTSVMSLLNVMAEKGLLTRDESVRPQVYRAARTERQVQRQLVGDLADRVFSGSPGSLALHALSSRKTTPEEREQIRRLLDKIEHES